MSAELAQSILREWEEHPSLMVRELFQATPDPWQEKVLEDFPHCQQQVMMCCKGPGKTAVLAWLAWNFLLTRRRPTKIGALSITSTNLRDNLWAEMARWRKESPLLMDQFEWRAERIFHKAHPEDWFISAKAWSQAANTQELGTVLAGLWADHVMFVLDEAGDIPVPILRTAEAVLGTQRLGGKEAHVLIAGNTSSSEGALYYAAIKQAQQYRVYAVTADPDDPNRTPRIDIEHARREIRDHGRDDPWVQINILAKFPAQGINHLIAAETVRECFGRHLPAAAYNWAPRILGGDPALFGDDRSVLFPRQGLAYFSPLILRGLDPLQLAGHWMHKANEWNAHSIQVEVAGGYGSGTTAIMRDHGYAVAEVEPSGKARDPRFFNKRAENWWRAIEHIKSGASLPSDCPELAAELAEPTYSYKGDRIIIEPKALVKARLGRSPDLADALCCTHSFAVAAPMETRRELFQFDVDFRTGKSKCEYDPLSRLGL